MTRTRIAAAGILLGICCALPPAARAVGSGGDGTIESYQKSITGATDKREEAVLRKELGELYAAQEDYPRAAAEYLQALALAPSAFTRRERLQMAIAISWADRFDDAATVLRSILAEDPNDRDARVHLAKVLSWSDKLQDRTSQAVSLASSFRHGRSSWDQPHLAHSVYGQDYSGI